MVDLIFLADLLRLSTVLLFGYAAWRDLKIRRVYDRVWIPIIVVGLISIGIELIHIIPIGGMLVPYLLQVSISVLIIGGVGLLFGMLRLVGGADAKALLSMSIAYPHQLSLIQVYGKSIGWLSFDAVFNTAIAIVILVLTLFVINLSQGDTDLKAILLAKKVYIDNILSKSGRLYEDEDGVRYDGVDLDALRMYLRWRGVSLETLIDNADHCRHPDSVGETHDPTDGRVGLETPISGYEEVDSSPTDESDLWGVDKFLNDVDRSVYGTSSEQLRSGLDSISNENVDRIYISPGLPLIVPLFLGILLSLLFGNIPLVIF